MSHRGQFWVGALCGAVSVSVLVTLLLPPMRRQKEESQSQISSREFLLTKKKTKQKSSQHTFGFLRRSSQSAIPDTSFLTEIMEELWAYVRIAGAEKIRAAVEPSFASLPAPMNSCRFIKLDLGDVPMRMDNIVVHPRQPDGSVQFDMDLKWDGQCDFQLKADFVGSFGIKHLKLTGKFAVILKPLVNEIPIVSGIQYGFLNAPTIDLSFSGLASVAELSVLNSSVQQAIQSSLSTSVLPYRRLYKMSANTNFLDTYQPPLGVLRLTVNRGHGFIIEKRFLAKDDIPDVYLLVSVGQDTLWRTTTVIDDLNPIWNETADFCLYDREQLVKIHAWDEDESPIDPDDDLGTTQITVSDMLMSPKRSIKLPLSLYNKGKKVQEPTGASVTLSCEICEWTSDLSSLDEAPTADIYQNIVGLLVVIVNRAFDLQLSDENLCTYVKVIYAGKEFETKMIYDCSGWDPLNPVYDTDFTIPITDDMPRTDEAQIRFDVINMINGVPNVVGTHVVSFADLKQEPRNTLTETQPIGENGASLQFRISLSGVNQHSSPEVPALSPLSPGTSFDTLMLRSPNEIDGKSVSFESEEFPSMHRFRLTVVKARGLTIREELFAFDVPDVYFEIHTESDLFCTSVKYNNVSPEWNESNDFALRHHSQILSIKGWDKNERDEDPDVFLGTVESTVGNLVLSGGYKELELHLPDERPSGIFVTVHAQVI